MTSSNQHPLQTKIASGHPAEPIISPSRLTTSRVATLERDSFQMVKRAGDAGIDITFLGIMPLFRDIRAYAGPHTDWIIRPADDQTDAIVPKAQRETLRRLVRAGINFPLVYIAHEIPKGRLALPSHAVDMPEPQPATVEQAVAADAIGPVPPSADTTALAQRLGRSSQHLLTALRTALPIAGAIVATPILIASAPFLLAGAAVGALAVGLDPIIFGVIPADLARPGQPAAWYVLARWEWPAAPDQQYQ